MHSICAVKFYHTSTLIQETFEIQVHSLHMQLTPPLHAAAFHVGVHAYTHSSSKTVSRPEAGISHVLGVP